MIVVHAKKRTEIITSIHVCLISRMNFDYKKMVERKAFPIKPKQRHRVSQKEKQNCTAQSQKNGYYYKNPSLFYLMDEL